MIDNYITLTISEENMIQSLTLEDINYDSKYYAAWIKYNRQKLGISQEALAYKVCSVSHLSYFENGKKNLRPELIEALLNKLDFKKVHNHQYIGSLRQNFSELTMYIEKFDYDKAQSVFNQIQSLSDILENTIYSIEYMVYKTAFMILVERKSYNELAEQITRIDNIYNSLTDDLKYFYALASGKLLYDFKCHSQGIKRLKRALELNDTSWVNYRLGVAYCYDNKHYLALKHLNRALVDYDRFGQFYNALWCHNFIGICMTNLGDFTEAEIHFEAVNDGSEYFSMNKNIFSIYTNLAELNYAKGEYNKSMVHSLQAIEYDSLEFPHSQWTKAAWHIPDESVKAACIYIESCSKLGELEKLKPIFDTFLKDTFKSSRYYLYLRFLYLRLVNTKAECLQSETTKSILPYYKKIGFLNVYNRISIDLASHLEDIRKYKSANAIYKQLLDI